jgi:hypothetical protein
MFHQCPEMKRIVKWIEKKLSYQKARVVNEQPNKQLTVDDLVMPDIYAVEHVETVPDLKIIDLSSPGESSEFNPYDTAVLRKK